MRCCSMQISSTISPGPKSAIPKKTTVKNSVVGVTRRNTFGYGDNKVPTIDQRTTNKTPTSNNQDLRRYFNQCCLCKKNDSFKFTCLVNDGIQKVCQCSDVMCFQLLQQISIHPHHTQWNGVKSMMGIT